MAEAVDSKPHAGLYFTVATFCAWFGLIVRAPLFLFVVLSLVFGLYFAWSGITGLIAVNRVKSWPTVQGTLHTKEIWKKGGNRNTAPSYIPLMRYYYIVNGEDYTCEKISYDSIPPAAKEDIMEQFSSYAVGMPVTVHYHPRDPAMAVLQVGSVSRNLRAAGLGMGAIIVGLLLGRPFWNLSDWRE